MLVIVTLNQIAAGIDALEALGAMSNWMDEWDRESTTAVERALDCPRDNARSLWKAWRDQNLVELLSDRGDQPGFKTDSKWRWQRVPQES